MYFVNYNHLIETFYEGLESFCIIEGDRILIVVRSPLPKHKPANQNTTVSCI